MTQAAVDVADARIPELSSRVLLDGLIYLVTAVPPLEISSKPPHIIDALYRLHGKMIGQRKLRFTGSNATDSGLSMYFVSQLE